MRITVRNSRKVRGGEPPIHNPQDFHGTRGPRECTSLIGDAQIQPFFIFSLLGMHTCFSIQHHSTAQVPGGGPLNTERLPFLPLFFPSLHKNRHLLSRPLLPSPASFFFVTDSYPLCERNGILAVFPFGRQAPHIQNAPFHQTPFGSPLGPPHPRLITILEEPLVSRSRSTSLLYLLLAPRSALTEGQVRITPQHLLPLRHASLQVDGIPSPSTASSRHSALAPSIFKARIFGH